jgi:hypothetical protein
MKIVTQALLTAFFCILSAATALAQIPTFAPGRVVGHVNADALREASGLAASRLNPGVLWSHNDGGWSAWLYALSTNGQLLSTWQLLNVRSGDFEDIAIGPGPVSGVQYIYLGDIGDNARLRESIRMVRVAEPVVALDTTNNPPLDSLAGAVEIELIYPTAPHNAEALLSDPITGDLFIATKVENQEVSRIFRAPKEELDRGGPVTLQYVREVPFKNPSGGDISPDGSEILLRRNSQAVWWKRASGKTVGQALAGQYYAVPVVGQPVEPNGEGIAFHPAGLGYYTISEGPWQPIYYFRRTSPRPYPRTFSRAKTEQRVVFSLRGEILEDPSAKPQRITVKTRQLIQAIGENLSPAIQFSRYATLHLITSPAGTERLVIRQVRQPDVDVTGYFPVFDLGNDRPDAVITQKYPGAPAKIDTTASWLVQLGPGVPFLDLAGPARNGTRPIKFQWLGGDRVREITQSLAKVSGWLWDQGAPVVPLAGFIRVGASRSISVAAFLAHDFDVGDAQFMVVNTGPVEWAWECGAALGTNSGREWHVNGTQQKGVPTSSALSSRPFFISKSGPVALLFEHRHHFQSNGDLPMDGGQVRVRVNDGPFQPVPAEAFVLNGYSGTVGGNNLLFQQPVFAGISPGYDNLEPVLSAAVLGSFNAGDLVVIQFVAAWDEWFKGAEPNWVVDNVAVVRW